MGAGLAVFMEDNEKTKKAALRLLAFRPRSESELRQRLAQKKLPADAIERTVDELRQSGMLDDEKFAKLYALSRIQSRAFGKDRVRRELSRRGLSGASVENAMRSIEDIDEEAPARELAQKRLASMKGLPREAKKRRLHGALLRRGFSANVTFRVLDRLLGPSEEE